MPRTFKLLTAALALAGSVSLLFTGQMNVFLSLPGLAILVGYYRHLRGLSPVDRRIISVLTVLELFVVIFDSYYVSHDFLLAVSHMTIVFQAMKGFDLREPWDKLQVFFMALLQLVITSELSNSMVVGAVFLVFSFLFMAALVYAHFEKEGSLGEVGFSRPLAMVTAIALLGTVVVFIVLPRFQYGLWGRRTGKSVQTVGFSEKVDFGAFGTVLGDDTVIMRAEIKGPSLPLYWRGMTLDNFDGVTWKNTEAQRRRFYVSGDKYDVLFIKDLPQTEQTVSLEPMDNEVLFALGTVASLKTKGIGLRGDTGGSLFMSMKRNRRFTYTAYSMPDGNLPVRPHERYAQLPPGMERIKKLAADIIKGKVDDLSRARTIESHLMKNYTYSVTTTAPPAGVSVVDHFLFNARQGYCEHYATAMALMLRTQGIPSRVVTGFMGGEVAPEGDYVVVRQKDAHSWVEAAIAGKWVSFDPTTPRLDEEDAITGLSFKSLRLFWYRHIVGFDTRDQEEVYRTLNLPVLELPKVKGFAISVSPVHGILAVLLGLALLSAYLLGKVSFALASYESRLYLKLRHVVKKHGGRLGPQSTAQDVVREARRLSLHPTHVERFVALYESSRFGAITLLPHERQEMKELLATIARRP